MSALRLVLISMRPRQWVKNVLLLAGLYFPQAEGQGPLLFDGSSFRRALMGFVIFCALSGAIYLLNDVIDAPRDRLHPKKRRRPIAAGRLSSVTALRVCVFVGLLGLVAAFWLSFAFGLCAMAYFVMEVFYSLILKDVFLIDTIIISMGFIIRAISGIIVLRTFDQFVELTPWFVICVLFLSLLLAFCKRRAELMNYQDHAASYRRVLSQYSPMLLDIGIAVCASATLLAYALYSVENERPWRMLSTMPLVLFGVFRYLHLVYTAGGGGAPEEDFFGDPTLLGCVVLWGLTLLLVFYPGA